MSLIQVPLVPPGIRGPYPGIHDFQWKLNRRCPRATIEQITINTDLEFSAQFTQVGVVVRWGLCAQRWTCCVINEAIYGFSHAFDELLNTIEQTILETDQEQLINENDIPSVTDRRQRNSLRVYSGPLVTPDQIERDESLHELHELYETINLTRPGEEGAYPGVQQLCQNIRRLCHSVEIVRVELRQYHAIDPYFQVARLRILLNYFDHTEWFQFDLAIVNLDTYDPQVYQSFLNTIVDRVNQRLAPPVWMRTYQNPPADEFRPVQNQSRNSSDEQPFTVNVTDEYNRPVSNWNVSPFESWTVTQPPPHIINDEDLEAARIQPLLIRDEATSVAGIHPTQSEQFDTEDIPIKLYDPQKAAIKRLMFLLDTVGLPENVKVQLRTFLANLNNPPSDSVPSSKRRKIDRSILEEERESPSV